ncbi:hypothetical protein AB0947_42735, partial [Streptomyces sp. NPDC047841]
GFGSPETLRRTFVARLGVSPGHYRARFATTHSDPRRTRTPAAGRNAGQNGTAGTPSAPTPRNEAPQPAERDG